MSETKEKKYEDVEAYVEPTFDGGTGVGSKSNLEKLAQDYVNSNYTDFTKGADYASLAKRHSQMGKQAMKDTMGQAAARTSGYANSYAIQAGQQAQNSYMANLEDAARSLYDSQMAEKANKLGVAQGIYDRNYSEFVDKRDFGYDLHRDEVADARYANEQMAADKEEYLNNLYTDFSLMNDEELESAIWEDYSEKAGALGISENDFDRYKKLVSSEKTASANAANAEMAEKNVQELEAELLNGGTFNPKDTRIPEGKQEYYYNFWKNGWKESALTLDNTKDQIEDGNLSPAVLKSYEVYYGESYCASELDDLNDKLLNIPTIALGSRGQMALATDGMSQELLKEVEKYVFAWYEYDAEGLNRYIESLDDESPIKVHLKKYVDDSSPPCRKISEKS